MDTETEETTTSKESWTKKRTTTVVSTRIHKYSNTLKRYYPATRARHLEFSINHHAATFKNTQVVPVSRIYCCFSIILNLSKCLCLFCMLCYLTETTTHHCSYH